MQYKAPGWSVFWQIVALSLAGSAVGTLFGAPAIGVIVALAGLLAWHYTHLSRLTTYLWRKKRFNPPDGAGSWKVIYDGLYRQQQRNRKRRKDLAKLLKRFRDGAEAMPDGVIVINADNAIIWCNHLSRVLLGLRWPGDAGQRIDNLVRHPDFIRYLQEKDSDDILVLHSPVHHSRMIEFRLTSYHHNQALLVVRDVTKWQQLEKMRRDFVVNVSHELRTPLTVMQGYVEMLDDPEAMPPGMWEKAQTMMTQQVKRMDSLVSELITLSKIESSPRPDMDQVIDVPAMLEAILVEAKALGEKKQQTVTLRCDESLKMCGDAMQMRSAFSNLVFNAVHYTQVGGEITILWKWDKHGGHFQVNDNGPGIAMQHLHRLTERFYRVDKARSRSTGGSGLGLSIVKHALSLHESELNIESEPGNGSQFGFLIKPEFIRK